MRGTWVGWLTAQERGLLQAAALALASSDWGMSVHLPSPSKRQPWYEHISVPSDGSMRPSALDHETVNNSIGLSPGSYIACTVSDVFKTR